MRLLRNAAIAATLLSLEGAPLPAQEGVRHEVGGTADGCPEAVALVRTSLERPEGRKALDRLVQCGADGYGAVADGIRSQRTSRDAVLLSRLNGFLRISPRGRLFEAVLDVAQDRSASLEARGAALYALSREVHRGVMISHDGLMSGLDPHGLPLKSCIRGQIAGAAEARQLAPSDLARLRQIASGLYRDASQPEGVRSAASCILS